MSSADPRECPISVEVVTFVCFFSALLRSVVLSCLTSLLSPGGKGVMLSALHVFLFHRQFPWNQIFVCLGKGFQLLYATYWDGGFLTVTEKGFHSFSLTAVVVRLLEWALLWTYPVATIIGQIFTHESFVQFCCMQDCCYFWGEGRGGKGAGWREPFPHQSAEIRLPSVTVAY